MVLLVMFYTVDTDSEKLHNTNTKSTQCSCSYVISYGWYINRCACDPCTVYACLSEVL